MHNPKTLVKFKKINDQVTVKDKAKIPTKATPVAAGLDLYSSEATTLLPGEYQAVHTGIAIELPPGHEGQVRPRSGLAVKYGVTVLNSPGTIDEDYRGEIKVVLINHGAEPFQINVGDRIGQLVVAKVADVVVEEVHALSDTDRGAKGFGSTGR